MIEQILPNNNEIWYSNFSATFREINPPLDYLSGMERLRPHHGAKEQ
jgi:hypothetical protein